VQHEKDVKGSDKRDRQQELIGTQNKRTRGYRRTEASWQIDSFEHMRKPRIKSEATNCQTTDTEKAQDATISDERRAYSEEGSPPI